MVIKMNDNKCITSEEKLNIIVHLIVNSYLTENQIKTIIKRGS